MIETGKDAGFIQVCFDILGPGDPLGARDLHRHQTVKLFVKGHEDITEPALAHAPQDGITPDLRRMLKRGRFL